MEKIVQDSLYNYHYFWSFIIIFTTTRETFSVTAQVMRNTIIMIYPVNNNIEFKARLYITMYKPNIDFLIMINNISTTTISPVNNVLLLPKQHC